MNNRHARLLEIVTENSRVEVARLAEELDVSRVTIRKDLDQLEEKGLIRREHGFALLASSDDITGRLAYPYDTKHRIAAAAAELVRDGETVMIESGSCCALLADRLASEKPGVMIITNSAFIAGYIRKRPHARMVLIGGDYQNEAQVMVGPVAHHCLASFHVDKLFIGTDGFSEKLGFMGADHLRAETVRAMAEQARQVVVLTESAKFGRLSAVSLLPLEKVAMVITDDAIPPATEKHLKKHGLTVMHAKK